MPRIGVGEKKKDWIARCISTRQKEHPDEKTDQSTAVCYSMWRDKHGGRRPSKK